MKIVIDIPKEFEDHFNLDRFADSLERILEDITSPNPVVMSGLYERETLEMLEKAFQESKPLIQCKDCKWHSKKKYWTNEGIIVRYWCSYFDVLVSDNHYCSCGERREDND